MNRNKYLAIILFILLSPACTFPTQTLNRTNTQVANLITTSSPSPIVFLTQTPTAPEFTDTPTVTPNLTFTSSPTPDTPETSASPESAAAEVITSAFCREGPGPVYRDITAFPVGTFLQVSGVNPERTWWRVVIPSTGGNCWTSGSLLSLSGNLDAVPVLNPPPTPTLTLTLTETLIPTDTPTPTQPPPPPPPSIVSSGVEGATISDYDHFEFTDELDPNHFLRIFVHDTRAGTNDGDGIPSVRFRLEDDETLEVVLDNTDTSPGFCIFGGGEPECNHWILEENVYKWTPGGKPIESGNFRLQVYMEVATPLEGGGNQVDWIANYTIAVP